MEYLIYGLLGIVGVLLLLLLIAVVRTFFIKAPKRTSHELKIDESTKMKYAQGLAELIQYKTIASKTNPDALVFTEMQSKMKELFPRVFETMEIKVFEGGSLLACWKGLNRLSQPLVLMAHQDVVPAPKEGWNTDPFQGVIQGNEVFGRGSFDTKCTLYAFFQAAEELLTKGFVPTTDIYLASSSDEEISGNGALETVEYLKSKGIQPKLVLDEGGAIVNGALPSSNQPIALIGVIEKGYVNILVKALSKGGHSSTPPKNSPIARLSFFISDIEKHFPLKTKMIPEVEDLFKTAAPTMSFGFRLLFGNLWLFKGLLTSLLPKINPYGRALLSTTISYTMMKGSDAENVIPNEASILLNCRTHPIQGINDTFQTLNQIAKKYDCHCEIIEGREASPIVNVTGEAYQAVKSSIQTIFPDVLISPYVILGGTDARHYTAITDAALRFSPIRVSNQDLKKMHGINESVSIDALAEAVIFYQHLIKEFH